MPGLSVLKDKPDPVALPDDQYPAWLWTLLDAPKPPAEGKFNFEVERKKLRAV
jgi:large subunit ribosomal protein L54